MSFAPVFQLLTILAVIAAVSIIVSAIKYRSNLGQNVRVDARRRIGSLYRVAALIGLLFALLAVILFPTVYVNATAIPGMFAALAPSLAGIVFVISAGLGESFWPRPKGQQRGAFLTRRPALVNAAPVALWAGITWALLLVLSLIFCGVVATHEGEAAGRAIALPTWNPNVSGENGPFPGWPYGIPMLVGTLILVLLTLLVLRIIARRPAISGVQPDVDQQLRQVSATNLVKGVQLSLSASLSGVLLTAGIAGSNGGSIDVDGYRAELAGYWWAYPAILLAFIAILTSLIVAARRQK